MKWDAAFSAIRTPHNLLRISIIPWHHFTFSREPRPNRSVSIPGYRARIWGGVVKLAMKLIMVKFIVSVLQAQGGDRGRRAALGLVVENREPKTAGGIMSGHLLLHYHLPCREAWSLENDAMHERVRGKTARIGEGEL